ncbi:MAG TPA: hypothetical protein VN285_03935, partial [Candidatus Deferrimicrobium sp.]|nr:hypothetical protein [Candidatus Deferrimicrobium sp.]
LILIGVLLLLRNAEVFNDNFWADLLLWFPVVLIAVGIEKIFAKSRAKIVSYLTSVLLFVGGLYIAFAGSRGDTTGSFFSKSTFSQNYDPSVSAVHAVVDLDDADLTIRDSGDELVYGQFDRFTRKPRIDYEVSGSEARVKLTSRPQSLLGGAVRIDTDEAQDWYLRFARNVPLEIECSGHESDLHLNFSTTPLRRLKLDADDAEIYLKLGDQEHLVEVEIAGQDSNLRLRVPQTVGLKVFGEDYKAYLVRVGLLADNGGFVTPGFDTLPTKIEVRLDDRLGSFSIDFF